MKKTILLAIVLVSLLQKSYGQLVSSSKTPINLAIAKIVIDSNDDALIKKTAILLQQDIAAITGNKIEIVNYLSKNNNIIIGTIKKSKFIKQFIKTKSTSVENKWEAYTIKTIDNQLIIAGNDRRRSAFGVFEVSKQIGVSPWYWWADVPIVKNKNIYINTNVTITDAPKVKYRGIFINDEAPCLSNWSKEKFGGFNHKFYEKVFELLLRNKANYIWPAMWGNAFYDDDSKNITTADTFGIVIGTSHHEPLMRAHDEWRRHGKKQKWNYDSTATGLQEFWQGGIQRATNEKIVTVGMRGDGDEPMSKETATTLLEKIVTDQRNIIASVTKKPAYETPQLWALYKEVQDYYDKGMRVPDDITLLLCDDNWGNIRKLPKLNEKPRKGGYGIYYHFDYVGGPRNYKWVNTNPLPRIWEQMHLAYEYNAKQIWIVNVGDIKPMELPISFFLDYAWNPEKINQNDIAPYTREWAKAQFGEKYAYDIAHIMAQYAKFNSRRKPELLDANTYNLQEWKQVVKAYQLILTTAEKIYTKIPDTYRDAFFQLVLHPVKACSNLNEMYYNVALNKDAYEKKYAIANEYANRVKQLYVNDSLITLEYHTMNNGKWNHMMSQTHIGYTYWQQPSFQKMPIVKYVPTDSIVNSRIIAEPDNANSITPKGLKGNYYYERENDGVVIHPANYTKAINSSNIKWTVLPDLGREADAITTFPVTAAVQTITSASPHLQYEIYTYSKDSVSVNCFFSPTLNFHNEPNGLQYAVSIDNETPQIISINKEDNASNTGIWNKWVAENIIIKTSKHKINEAGKHTVKYWMINSGVVLQKINLHFTNFTKSYLGGIETRVRY